MDILISFFPMCYFYKCFEQFQLEMYIYFTASTDIYQDYSYSYTIRPIFVHLILTCPNYHVCDIISMFYT